MSSPCHPEVEPARITPLMTAARARHVAEFLVLLPLALVVGVGLLDFPTVVAGPGLDASWMQSFHYFRLHHLQAGKDYVFTFGPLGYLTSRGYSEEFFWTNYAWEVGLKLVFVFTLLALLRRVPGLLSRVACCLTLLGSAHLVQIIAPDFFYFLLIVSLALLTIGSERPHIVFLALVGMVLAVLSLTKFTFLLLSAAAVMLVTVRMAAGRPRTRALLLPALYLPFFGGLWCALGQDPANLPRYLHGSLQIASGYVDAMAIAGTARERWLALGVTALLASTLCARRVWPLVTAQNVCAGGLLTVALYLEWRHGFIRQDEHAAAFFSYCLVLPFLMPAALAGYRWTAPWRVLALAFCVPLSVVGILTATHGRLAADDFEIRLGAHFHRNFARLWAPGQLEGGLHAALAMGRTEWALPRIAARVGGASVDVLSSAQGVAFLNALQWRPRPVFQSYSAYTPYLMARNARHFRQPKAPEYVLVKLEALDRRPPALEDALAFLEILARYEPILSEKSFLLLKRRPHGEQPKAWAARMVRQIRMDQKIAIDPSSCPAQKLSIRLEYTFLGKLRRLVYKPATLHLNVQTADGAEHHFRLVPGMARDGFLINPLILDNADIIHLYGADAGKRVVALSITGDAGRWRCYKHDVSLVLEDVPGLAGPPLEPARARTLLYPMFDTTPLEARSAVTVSPRCCDGDEVLVVHPDGELAFQVPPGAHTVSGKFGITPDAYAKGATDGVQFTVVHIAPDGVERVLFRRYLDPSAEPRDRGMQTFRAELPQSAGRVVCRTTNLPGKTVDCDWSYWTRIALR
jgi:hypothetical protein